MRPLGSDLVRLESLCVGGLTIERSIVLLISVVMLGYVVFSPFGLELLAVGGLCFETTSAGSVLVLTGGGSLYYYFGWHVFFLILSGIVELGSIGLVGISGMDLCGWALERLVIGAVGGLE